MNDRKILSAILALHERFVEEPTEQKASHIQRFIRESRYDVDPPIWTKLRKYSLAVGVCCIERFSSKSIAHLNEVAKECLG